MQADRVLLTQRQPGESDLDNRAGQAFQAGVQLNLHLQLAQHGTCGTTGSCPNSTSPQTCA